VIPGRWCEIEDFIQILSADAIIVISMLYHDFEIQYNIFQACIIQQVSLFITWDSGMELQVF
jgi:hypothetical protein